MDEPTKYVCTAEDLDLLLDEDLKRQFRALFSDSWRLNYKGQTPKAFLKQFEIDYDKPTVRDAVAFDLVKLDNESVSNDRVYTFEERKNYSPMEYERYLLHKNFRINLVNLDPDWSEITYKNESGEEAAPKRKRTVDKVFQGPRLSSTLLDYFSKVMENDGSEIYIPFTNANDFSMEVSLIPNTHPDFRQITSRAYYDTKWAQYKRLCQKHGFANIATFALVDAKKDKNHTGEFLVKFQKAVSGRYKYLVVKMDRNGQILSDPTDPIIWTSNVNSILCVCEDDFYRDQMGDSTREEETWEPVVRDIPMVHSTTSSHYSIFRQRVPDYDLKLVRHYLQFKNRLEGMELCLDQVKKDVHHKEVRSAECFSKLTMVLKRLMDEFASNKELMALLSKWYDLLAEWDKLETKKIQIRESKDGKLDLLHRLQDEYRALNDDTRPIGRRLDHKLALGQRIASLKLELRKSVEQSLAAIDERIEEISNPISGEMKQISDQIADIQSQSPDDWHIPDDIVTRIQDELNDSTISQVQEDADKIVEEMKKKTKKDDDSTESRLVDFDIQVRSKPIAKVAAEEPSSHPSDEDAPQIDTTRLHRLVVQSERWRNYSYNIGYELSQFKKMLTMCDDATIKVRRLLHNFEERMKDTQEQVWDENYQLRPDFDFKDITVAGLRDVILLHDWWAANAPGKTPEEMGMTDEEFMAFRRRCNKVSYNLRKNQYAQLLAVRKDRTQNRISELEELIKDKKTLHWDDKYGTDASRDDGEEPWSVEDANAKARARIKLLAEAEDIIEEESDAPRSTIVATRDMAKHKRISSIVSVELEDEEPSEVEATPSRRQLATKRVAKSVINGEATYRECLEMERQYKADAKKLVERTMNYLKHLGLAETEADVERLALANASTRSPEVSQRWLEEIQSQREQLDSSIELMRNQRKSMQSIIDNVAKMETAIQELKQKNKRIFDICMKAGKKVKGVDKQVRNRMLMDKIDNEQRIFELKQLVKKARSQHLEDFSSLEKMRKEVDEKQSAYDQKVRDFKADIGLTKEVVDNLMVGIYNKFQDEILEHDNRRNKK